VLFSIFSSLLVLLILCLNNTNNQPDLHRCFWCFSKKIKNILLEWMESISLIDSLKNLQGYCVWTTFSYRRSQRMWLCRFSKLQQFAWKIRPFAKKYQINIPNYVKMIFQHSPNFSNTLPFLQSLITYYLILLRANKFMT